MWTVKAHEAATSFEAPKWARRDMRSATADIHAERALSGILPPSDTARDVIQAATPNMH